MPQGRDAGSNTIMHVCAPLLLLALLLAAPLRAAGADSTIGNFDISKVSALAAPGNSVAVTTAPSEDGQTVSAALLTLRMIGWLVLLLAILWAGAWAVKKIGLAGKSKIGGGSMDILEALPLGQGKNILLVRVLDKVYVLGQTAQQITILAAFEGQQALSLIAQKGEIVSLSQFKDVFHSFMDKFKKS